VPDDRGRRRHDVDQPPVGRSQEGGADPGPDPDQLLQRRPNGGSIRMPRIVQGVDEERPMRERVVDLGEPTQLLADVQGRDVRRRAQLRPHSALDRVFSDPDADEREQSERREREPDEGQGEPA
jgi:hypothetical protein